jgi:glycosyltransferase involved in cell wall biosynthesis
VARGINLISVLWNFRFLLHASKKARIRAIFASVIREFKKNGIRGVLARAQGTISSPYALLAYTYDKVYATGTISQLRLSEGFVPEAGKVSIVVPISSDQEDFYQTAIDSLLRRGDKSAEVIVVASGWDHGRARRAEELSLKQGFKFFHFPETYSSERLFHKGLKEAKGEFIFFADTRRLGKGNPSAGRRLELGPKMKNDGVFREKLPQKVAYVVPRIGISGGISVVLQHSNRLLERGHDVSIITLNPFAGEDWFDIKVPLIEAGTRRGYLLDNIDILIATHWTTVLYMSLLPAGRKIYFVQSDERRYSPNNEKEVRTIEATYRTSCEYMTEAVWIQRWLKEEFGHDAYYVPNGIDLNLFHRTEPLEARGTRPRVLIEGGIDFWFKGMEDAYNAVKDLDVDIWIVSSQGKPKPHWRYDRFFQDVPIQEMKRIYSSCDVFLKMSKMEGFFGPPMEAMACGCPVVVGRVTGYDEYIEDGRNALVVDNGDVNSAVRAVNRLITNPGLRQNLVQAGFETVKNWSWGRTLDALEKVVTKEPPGIYYTNSFPEGYCFEKWKQAAGLR